MLGYARNPRCFNGVDLPGSGLLYRSTAKAWMKRGVSFNWLCTFDAYIVQTPDRSAALVIDNACDHGYAESIPILFTTDVIFLPPGTTSRLQPLDAGIISFLKQNYRQKQIENAIDLLERGVTVDLCKSDLLNIMKMIYEIWYSMDNRIFQNCWRKIGLAPAPD